MATEKETIIYDFQIQQNDAVADLEKFKRSIVLNRDEIKKLNDDYKKGTVTLEEYASESVRLEQILKKETTAYNNLTKQVQGHESQTEKLIKSNKELVASNEKISGNFQQMAGNINIAGTNLGSLTSGMTAFLNPVTAAGAAVGALATAYFSTGRGAQDLESIQFKLQATTEVLSNKVADFVDELKDGDGAFASFTKSVWDNSFAAKALTLAWRSTIGDQVDALAGIKAQLDDLDESRAVAQAKFNNLLDDNSTLSAEINESTTSYLEKQDKLALMQDNIIAAFDETLKIKQEEVRLLNEVLEVNKDDEATRRRINAINLEIAQEERKREKMLSNISKTADNIESAEAKTVANIAAQNEKLIEQNAIKVSNEEFERLKSERLAAEAEQAEIDAMAAINRVDENAAVEESIKLINDEIAAETSYTAAKEKGAKATKAAAQVDKDRTASLLILSNAIGGAAAIFEKHTIASKLLSAAQAGINSFLAGTEVLKDPSFVGRPLQRTIAMFATIAAGLAQQGRILGAFGGGGSFTTKGPTWLLVGDNPGGRERVDVTPVSGKGTTKIFNDGLAMAGGGSINGSILAASSTAPIDAQFSINDAIRELPAPVLDYTEFSQFTNKVAFKESITQG